MTPASTARLDAADLDGALAALLVEVREHPTDVALRSSLAELACFAGDLERADRQLDAIAELDVSVAVGVALFRQLVRAEQARQAFYNNGALPEFIAAPSELDKAYLKALLAVREGDERGAVALLAEAEDMRPPLQGTLDEVPFDDLRDLDDICACHFDILTSTGKFYWVPMHRVRSLTLHKPRRRRDLLWRQASLDVESGPSGEVFVPTIYSEVGGPLSGALRLGRQTEFIGGGEVPVRGRGQRSFLVGEEARSILEIGSLQFTALPS